MANNTLAENERARARACPHTDTCNNTHDGLMPIELLPCCFALEARVGIDSGDSKASQDQFLVKANGSSRFRWIYGSDGFSINVFSIHK